jgi:hypothetical protein
VRLVSQERSKAGPASRTSGERAGRRASKRTVSGTVSAVTAAPARIPTPAPKAAPKVAAVLLESTLVGGLGVDTLEIETSAEAVSPERMIKIESPEALIEIEHAPQILPDQHDPDIDAEIAEEQARKQQALDRENDPGEDLSLKTTNGNWKHCYDFEHPRDKSKVAPEVLALFPNFGLSTITPSSEISEEDMKEWILATLYKSEPDEAGKKARLESDLSAYRTPQKIYDMFKRRIEPHIQRERDRIVVWKAIRVRVIDIEQLHDQVQKDELSLEDAQINSAKYDCWSRGNLTESQLVVWREIVDAMTWPEGFSRIDLARWAQVDPAERGRIRIWEGPPRIYPPHIMKRFHPDRPDLWGGSAQQ